MGAAKKLGMLPDEAWLSERVKDGRAVKTLVSMKALGEPDIRLQQRVEHLNIDHVHRLDRMRLGGSDIFPIVVFHDEASDKHHVADGFHRHEMYRRANLDAIPAYVIQGTWRDAMVYSTMCNQLAILNRKPEDIKKAVFTLLDDEEWRGKSDSVIGSHCGCVGATMAKYRAEHSVARNVPIPEMVECRDGKTRPYRKTSDRPSIAITKRISRSGVHGYCAKIGGKYVTLPSDHAKAQAIIDNRVAAKSEQRQGLTPGSVRTYLARRSLLFDSGNLNPRFGLGGASKGYGVVFVPEPFDRPSGGQSSYSVPAAVGRVLLARQLIDPSARAVVVCYVEDAPPELIEAGRALGVEFLAPEELVASLKGDGDGSVTPQPESSLE